MNKKSNLVDFLTAGGIVLGLVFTTFIMFTILDNFSDGVAASGVANDTSVVDLPTFIDTSNTKLSKSVDWAILFIAIAAMIFSYIAATKIPTDPKIIIVVLLFVFVFFIISMGISNIFAALMQQAKINTFVNINMPISKILLRYFPFYGLIYDFVVLVGFFGKQEGRL